MDMLKAAAQHILVSALVAGLAVGPAAPSFADVVQKAGGNTAMGAVTNAANGWNVTVQNGSIVHYSSFDVAKDQVVTFMNQNAGGGDVRVLNRILSAVPAKSNIDGTVTGQGGNFFLYFVNPAGVAFGPNAQINVAGLEAVGGHLSDKDFKAGVDHFTGVRGPVTNAGQIAANAVSLVGGTVANTGSVITEGGWIVMAAGNDVLIGRSTNNNGVLLRVEGAANAVFNPGATGVSNTGTLSAGSASNPGSGTISLGAGDLYGTAIFSNNAIEARRIALTASQKGDVVLGGSVQASQLQADFLGGKNGTLKGAGGASAPTTINADSVTLNADATKGDVTVGTGLEFRGLTDPTHGPPQVTVNQQHNLTTSNLAGLDMGTDHTDVALRLTSAGTITVTDKKLVDGTDLSVSGATGVDFQGKDPLTVHTLNVQAPTTISDGDLVVTGSDPDPNTPAFQVQGNLQFLTPDVKPGDPSPTTLLSAHDGTLSVTSDITTTNGGTLKIEGKNVQLGTFDPNVGGAEGGTIDVSGSIAPHVIIGFSDPNGVQLTQTVNLNGINASGAQHKVGDPPVAGGDVAINAVGDVTINGDINTKGQASGKKNVPDLPGGNVDIHTTSANLTVGSIETGGADAPTNGAAETGAVRLSAGHTITVNGNLDATSTATGNADGSRDRTVDLELADADGQIVMGADALNISGGNVTLSRQLVEGQKLDTDGITEVTRAVDLSLGASGNLLLGGGGTANSLAVTTRGGDIVLGGDLNVATVASLNFSTSGTGHVKTTGNVQTINAQEVDVSAIEPVTSTSTSSKTPPPSTANVSLDPNLLLNLLPTPDDPTTSENEFVPGKFSLFQDAAIDSAATDALFTTTGGGPRFVGGVAGKTFVLEAQNGTVTLDANARQNLAGTKLTVIGDDFSAPGTDSPLDVQSLLLQIDNDLNASFTATATDSISLQAGVSGTGNLVLTGSLNAPSISLQAGTGSGTGTVTINGSASLRDSDGVSGVQSVSIQQDSDLATSSLPDLSVFGPPRSSPLSYSLSSANGTLTVSSGADAKIAGTSLTLSGAQGLDISAGVPVVASLDASSGVALDVETRLQTLPGGRIGLHGGTSGKGNLTVGSELDASQIDLSAGSGNGQDAKSRVVLSNTARFASADSTAAPDEFSLTQDAAIGAGGSTTPVPDASFFAGSMKGNAFGLTSSGDSVTIPDTTLVDGTALTLTGKTGVVVQGDLLHLVSLSTSGATSLAGSVAATGDVDLNGAVSLTGTNGTVPVDQSIVAGGDLTATSTVSKTAFGALQLEAGGALTTGAIAISHVGNNLTHVGDDITISGTESVTTGEIDASASLTNNAGNVKVTSDGNVVLGGIDASGSAGLAATKSQIATQGTNGGTIDVTGLTITTGTVKSTGGDAGAPLALPTGATGPVQAVAGKDAGAITLTAIGGINLSGDVIATGGAGASTDPTKPAGGLTGKAADVTLTGPIGLLEDTTVATNTPDTIRGDHVTLGAVGPSLESSAPVVANTGVKVVAESSLNVGPVLNAGSVDLELHADGPLALGPVQIQADTIRLAASDGVNTPTNGTGAHQNGSVDLEGLTFAGSSGTGPVGSFTLEQDQSIGGTSSTPVPSLALFGGGGTVNGKPFALGLISDDGTVTVGPADIANVANTALTVAAGAAVDPTVAPTIQIDPAGGVLSLASLNVGTLTGAAGGTVGGNALVGSTDPTAPKSALFLGTAESFSSGLPVLTSLGSLHVQGDLTALGSMIFPGTLDQKVQVDGAFQIQGFNTEKTGSGQLTLQSPDFQLSDTAQTLSSDVGTLDIEGQLVKAQGSLLLIGQSADGVVPGVIVHSGLPVALQTWGGDLSIASGAPAATGSNTPGVGGIELDGDVSAVGNLTLGGSLVLNGNHPQYTFTAETNPADGSGGTLTVGGMTSADGDALFTAPGQDPSTSQEHPSAILVSGTFDSAHALEFDGATEATASTTMVADGNVHFDSRIQGAGPLDVTSHSVLELDDDVAMTTGALGLRGDSGVLFASDDSSQTITAASITLGGGAPRPPAGTANFVRDGDLFLDASAGSLTMGAGQALVASGTLSLAASDTATLANVAARQVSIHSGRLDVIGGSTVAGNSITTSAKPKVVSGGGAIFGVPTRTEVSSNVPSDSVSVRGLSPSGGPIAISIPADFAPGEFPAVLFPSVTGAALFDYARLIPELEPQHPLTQPRADAFALDSAVENRPLWAEELVAYLEQRSLETPDAKLEECELLPPVGARPGEIVGPKDARVRKAAVENAVMLYRKVFRPELKRDPETGVVEAPNRSAELRAAFQAPVDALRRDAKPVDGAAVAELIDRDARFSAVKADREELTDLLELGARALTPDQQPRFRELVLADITPHGIAPAEFDNALR